MTKHAWKFYRAGGFDQVRLETGADLMNLGELDLKLWVALACPASGLEFSTETLAFIDTDKDGRIRAPELIAAARWAGSRLTNPDNLVAGGDALELSAIADPTLRECARKICAILGNPNPTMITLAEARETDKFFAGTKFNGDGIIIPESAEDQATRSVIDDIALCFGTVRDRSSKEGIDQAKVDAFFTECSAFDEWHRKAEADAAQVLPLDGGTVAAALAVRAIKTKIDDYFGRCRLAAFDPRTAALLNRKEEEYLTVAARDLSITAAEVAGFPLALVSSDRPLPLKSGLNPAHAGAIATLHVDAVEPLLGKRDALTEADWLKLLARLEAFETWYATKAGTAVEKLGLARVREILGSGAKEAVAAIIEKEKSYEAEAAAVTDVEKLLRLKRDLYMLCTNFVNFRDFYDAGEPAIFQAGTLYLDQRSCTLTLPVEDVARHAIMAGLAGSYLAYCDCVRKGTGERRQIVAAFTNGDSDNLLVGRNGLFIDRKGNDWDATITKIVENPISVRQSFWSPYKKLVRTIEQQFAKRAAAADAAGFKSVTTGVGGAVKPPVQPKKVDVGTVAAMGVAVGALATAFAAFAGYVSGLLKLPFWKLCLAIGALLLLVSGPAMMIAWMKLNKRNLGPLLDSSGWAVNAKARLNIKLGKSLTGVAKLPPGSTRDSRDRFGDRPNFWPRLALFVVIVCFFFSLLNHFYVLDAIYFRATGQHNPVWFKQMPSSPVSAPAP